MPNVDSIIRYENGEMSYDETVEFFQGLLTSGAIRCLQGSYQRQANALIEAGLIG